MRTSIFNIGIKPVFFLLFIFVILTSFSYAFGISDSFKFITGRATAVDAKPSPCAPYGDINDDGYITNEDSTILAQNITGQVQLTQEQQKRADVTNDGKISVADILYISQYIAGLRDNFPVCEQVADLAMTKLLIAPLSPKVNEIVSVHPVFKNLGPATLKNYSVIFDFGDGNIRVETFGDEFPLPPGETTGVTVFHNYTVAGTYVVTTAVYSNVTDPNTDNNNMTLEISALNFVSCNGYHGDTDKDGIVTEADASLIAQYLVGSTELSSEQKLRADVNDKDGVTVADILYISQYIAGVRDNFPVCELPDLNAKIKVAPMKKTYEIGEVVNLTDSTGVQSTQNLPKVNPESNAQERVSDFTGQISDESMIPLSQKTTNFTGYIIEFKEPSLIERTKPLLDEIGKQQRLVNSLEKEISTKSAWYNVIERINNRLKRAQLNREKAKVETLQANLYSTSIKQIKKIETYQNAIKSRYSKNILGSYKLTFSGIAVNISADESDNIRKLDFVKDIYPNLEVRAMLMDSIPLIGADQVWQMDATGDNCQQTGEPCITGEGITIAILDTGIGYTHSDLGGCLGEGCKVIDGFDFINNDDDPMDDHGHGTHVAAIAAGKADYDGDGIKDEGELWGVAPDAELVGYKVLSSYGSGTFATIIAGIERAVDPNQDGDISDHLDIISMSLGGDCYSDGVYTAGCGPDDPLSRAADNAVDSGVVVVVAAGNGGSYYGIATPGTARKVITVGATDKKDLIAGFTSRGPILGEYFDSVKPDVVAPGAFICAAQWDNWLNNRKCIDDEHINISGTSMATPHVSGAAALILQAHPDWAPQEIKHALRNTAVDIGKNILTQGYGRVNVLKAIQSSRPPIANILNVSGEINDTIIITGTATGTNYAVYWGVGVSPAEWYEISNGTYAINDILAIWNVSQIKEDVYAIKLTAVIEAEKTEDRVFVTTHEDLQEGWPVSTGSRVVSSPVLYDINNDGYYEIFVNSADGNVYGFNYNGTYLPGWPVKIQPLSGHQWSAVSSPAMADLDEDGDVEIIVASNSYKNGADTVPPKVHAFHHNGTAVDGWPVELGVLHCPNEEPVIWSDEILATPVVADLDNDGDVEIFIGTSYYTFAYLLNSTGGTIWMHRGQFHADWNCDGETEPGDLQSYIAIINTPAIADLDNDGNLEIVGVGLLDLYGGSVYSFYHNGTRIDWPLNIYPYTYLLYASPAIADLNNDGNLEIVIVSLGVKGKYYVLLLDSDWNVIWGKALPDSVFYLFSSPAIGNIDSDDDLEMVVGGGTHVYAFNYDSTEVDGWPVEIEGKYNFIDTSPAIGDIDGDGDAEIIVGSIGTLLPNKRSHLHIIKKDGTILKEKLTGHSIFLSSPALADIDNDGDLEIVVGSKDKKVYAWDLNGTNNSKEIEWPMFHYDAQRTGFYGRPLPKSVIDNKYNLDITGLLTMKIQNKVGEDWQDVQIVVNSLNVVIPAKYELALDTIWYEYGAYITAETGTFRVYAELRDADGSIIKAPEELKATYEFIVS